MGGKVFGFSHAWTRNQLMVDEKLGMGVVREGVDRMPVEEVRAGRKFYKRSRDAALGFDGDQIHVGGRPATVLAEIPDPRTGDIELYLQVANEDGSQGGTYRQRWAKTAEGRHISTDRPRRIFSF